MASERIEDLVPVPTAGWDIYAACLGESPAEFYSDGDAGYEDLRWQEHCAECDVRADCLAESLRHREAWGVWGGFTPTARGRLLALLLNGTVGWSQVAAAVRSG